MSEKCLAFVPVGSDEQAWMPCGNDAFRSGLCSKHHEVFMGIILGLKSVLAFVPDPIPHHESAIEALIELTKHREAMRVKRFERNVRRER